MNDLYIGIDPGASGAICALVPVTNDIAFMQPPYDRNTYARILACEDVCNVRIIMIEHVSSIPGASAGSNFKFGYNTGQVNTIAEITGIGTDLVRPKAWQKKIGVTKKGPAIKKEVASIAHRLYPDAELYGPRGGLLDGRSDALMIAHFAFLKYNQVTK